MATSRVMASSSASYAITSDLTCQSFLHSTLNVVDDLLFQTSSNSPKNNNNNNNNNDDVWNDIDVFGGDADVDSEMTLEDFLSKAGVVKEDDDDHGGPTGTLEDKEKSEKIGLVVDKAALQRQKRMIKNRVSVARSRERKQAYTMELESLVTQLEEENAELLRYQEEQSRKRLKQVRILCRFLAHRACDPSY